MMKREYILVFIITLLAVAVYLFVLSYSIAN